MKNPPRRLAEPMNETAESGGILKGRRWPTTYRGNTIHRTTSGTTMDLEGRRGARRQTMTLKRKRNRSRRSVACEDIYTRQAERVGLRPEAKGLQHRKKRWNRALCI